MLSLDARLRGHDGGGCSIKGHSRENGNPASINVRNSFYTGSCKPVITASVPSGNLDSADHRKT